MTEAVNAETLILTPEQLAAYHDRFLPGAPPVTVESLRRHADVHGPYMVAETAWERGLKSPVGAVDPPSQKPRRRRR